MITNVTSKVDLPATASRTGQPDALPKNERVVKHTLGTDFTVESPSNRGTLEQAVGKVREALQQSASHLKIEVDQDSKRLVFKILKGDSGEVIRQIPPQEVIDLAKNLSGLKGLLFEGHV